MEHFGITIKLNTKKKEITEKDYEPFFRSLYSLGRKVFMIAELDGKNVLHYHGVVDLPRGLWHKKLNVKGFHWKIESIWNFYGWQSYCYKNYHYDDYRDTMHYLRCDEKVTIAVKKPLRKKKVTMKTVKAKIKRRKKQGLPPQLLKHMGFPLPCDQ